MTQCCGPTCTFSWKTRQTPTRPILSPSSIRKPEAVQLQFTHHKHFISACIYLRAHDFPIGAVAGVAVFIPFHSIRGDVSINRARLSCNCKTESALEIVSISFAHLSFHLAKTATFLTVGPSSVWWAQAAISIDLIHTGGAQGTRRGLALVNI